MKKGCVDLGSQTSDFCVNTALRYGSSMIEVCGRNARKTRKLSGRSGTCEPREGLPWALRASKPSGPMVKTLETSFSFFQHTDGCTYTQSLLLDLRSIDVGGAQEKEATFIIKTF